MIDRRATGGALLEAIRDSRTDPRAVLDDLASGSRALVRHSISQRRLGALAERGWTAFRARWVDKLQNELGSSTEPLISPETAHRREVRTGVKTARAEDFIIQPASWRPGPGGTMAPSDLPAVAGLLNSAFYQWMLRGLGAPRADETIEITATNLAELPFPRLNGKHLKEVGSIVGAVTAALAEKDPVTRIWRFQAQRALLDDYVFELVGASQRLRAVVRSELIRVA